MKYEPKTTRKMRDDHWSLCVACMGTKLQNRAKDILADLDRAEAIIESLQQQVGELQGALTNILSKMRNKTFSGPGPANRPITHYFGRLSLQDYDKALALLPPVAAVGE